MSTTRADLLATIAVLLESRSFGHPLRVGVDGVCGSGKSTFARDLVAAVQATGRSAIHVDSDGFHHVRARRHRQGTDSARGYYEDAYDFDALARHVLVPLGPGGCGRYAVRVHDLVSDAVIAGETALAPPDGVVVFDATFLQRGLLRELWDEVVYLDVDEPVALERVVVRDAARLGGEDAARTAHEGRYMAACRIYLAEERPAERASIVVDNTEPGGPRLIRHSHSTSLHRESNGRTIRRR